MPHFYTASVVDKDCSDSYRARPETFIFICNKLLERVVEGSSWQFSVLSILTGALCDGLIDVIYLNNCGDQTPLHHDHTLQQRGG